MSYAHWHVHALTHLGTAEADDLLLELLKEPEYERFVCEELARRAGSKTDEPLAQKVEYARIWDVRESLVHKNDAKSPRYADALRSRIAICMANAQRLPSRNPIIGRCGTGKNRLCTTIGSGSLETPSLRSTASVQRALFSS